MARISVIGGTGYAGGAIVRAAAGRGHEVTAMARTAPAEPVEGVRYLQGDARDESAVKAVIDGADVVVHALAPRGDLAGRLPEVAANVARMVRDAGGRLGVVGGAGSLRVPGTQILVMHTPDFPAEFRAEAAEMGTILADLRASDESLDWFFVSPAGTFGPWAAGEHTGTFRLGGDELLADAAGNSFISGADFAHAFVDEIERPTHRRERFTVAY